MVQWKNGMEKNPHTHMQYPRMIHSPE